MYSQNKATDKSEAICKVVTSQDNQLLTKYGHAYFPFPSIQKSLVSSRAHSLFHSYPCWFIKQSLMHTQQFAQLSKQIISVDIKEMYLFQEKQRFPTKFKLLSSVANISFTNLKVLHIMLLRDSNFEEMGWIDAPLLQQVYVSTHGCFTSVKPLQKGNWKHLYLVNLRVVGESKQEGRMFDLREFHRTRLLSSEYSELPKAKLYTPPGTLSICRSDLSNISYLSKSQISRLTNFHVPHLPLGNNQHHRFTPNVQHPWCPQLQFCQCKVYRALNRRFDNKTIALSIVDYVLDQDADYERRYVRRNRVLDDGSDGGEDQSGDEDLD